MSIDVRPENGNYAVILEADDIASNIQLARRAESFAKRHASPTVL